jgi:hypothetical protein
MWRESYMKKITRILFVVISLIGITSISLVQAEQPNKHVTWGAVNALFQAGFTGGFLVRSHDNLNPALVKGEEGRISPWFPGEYCVNDAHVMMIGMWFNIEDHELAKEIYLSELNGEVVTNLIMDGNYLETKMTTLKRSLAVFPPEPHYGWLYSVGVLFKPGEIPVGEHTITISFDLWIDGVGYVTMFEWYSFFNILECWH